MTTPDTTTMTIAISGASGLIGSVIANRLTSDGRGIIRLVRHPTDEPDAAHWDPTGGLVDLAKLDGIDALIHLAGENIASGRWTDERKRAIRDSRVNGTRTLFESLSRMDRPPMTILCASAVGFYGDRGDERLTEESESGKGFLAEVCRDWESAARDAAPTGSRLVHLRFGVVLSADDGMLPRLLPVFRAGMGGPVGGGDQYMSWVAIDDVVRIVERVLSDEQIVGAINVVAPQPVTNREFGKTLGHVIGRPAVVPTPAFAVRLAMGKMADELVLASTRAIPARLDRAGHEFAFPTLETALRHVLDEHDE